MYTVKDIYNAFFTNTDRYYDSQIAADFYDVDPEDMALLFFENIDKYDYTRQEFKQVYSLVNEFQQLVHSNFNFWVYDESETGRRIVRAG